MLPSERTDYLVRRAADFEELWSISVGENNWVTEELEGLVLFYVWPEPEFAEAFMSATHKQAGATPQRIDLYEFINVHIPEMSKQNISLSVFYGPDEKSWVFSPKEMKEALEEELKQYM